MPQTPAALPLAPGLAAREVAVELVVAVLERHRSLDDALAVAFARSPAADLDPRDRGFARHLAATTLRYARPLERVVAGCLEKPLSEKSRRVGYILLVAATQLLLLDTPPHAAISLAVDQTRRAPGGTRLDKLTNAVLRRIAREGRSAFDASDPAVAALPDWLWSRWQSAYGPERARALAAACLEEAALDLSLKTPSEAATWAERLSGALLATGSIRLAPSGRIEDVAGFAEGAWWVQDAAAALPVRLLGPVDGLNVVDLCAAPGGKTAELAAAGADVTAVDISPDRLARVRQNLDRLGLNASLVTADAGVWRPSAPVDAVLLDAPCTATGTIRRHPDILHLKRDTDLAALVDVQAQLLAHAVTMVRPGGSIVYCTCSLEPEEGEQQISRLLAATDTVEPVPIIPGEAGIAAEWITPSGMLRTLPMHRPAIAQTFHREGDGTLPLRDGLDGFFAARLRRKG
ncbi:MAG: transcription antitermination factor NusB [Hyphomicrobiaceae bacterium]|nr:transcription antitermination factor NusB [Hyphomicrobiaceae bacterium]